MAAIAIISNFLRKYPLAVIFPNLATLYCLHGDAHFFRHAIAIETQKVVLSGTKLFAHGK